jgi:hypothetical protein
MTWEERCEHFRIPLSHDEIKWCQKIALELAESLGMDHTLCHGHFYNAVALSFKKGKYIERYDSGRADTRETKPREPDTSSMGGALGRGPT